MANITGFTSPWNSNRWVSNAEPLDAKTIFNFLEDIDDSVNGIPGDQRFKGQKFVVKIVYEKDENNQYVLDEDDEKINIGPKEYWFVDDYQREDILYWDSKNDGLPEGDGWYTEDGFDGWYVKEIPEIIPEPVLYTPDIPEVNLDDIWRAIKTHKHIFKVRKPVTALEVGGVKKGDKLFNLHCA